MEMKRLFTTLFFFTVLFSAKAQFPENVIVLDVDLNKTKVINGSLSEGQYVDMRFGLRPAIHCYTAPQKMYFSGHHVLYAIKVPANTKVLVELNTRGNMSLYAYMISADRYDVPPYVEVVSKSGCSSSMKPMGELDRVMMKAGTVSTHVIVGVSGIEEANSGAFNLKITTKS